jgi:type VI secretion system protein ImpM
MSGAVGVFGKLPGLGDFLARSLDPAFTDPWHAWLAHQLPAARSTLAGRFEDAYMQAPVWRFALPRATAGPGPMTGVMMPSIDAVGREFPLTLAAGGAAAAAPWYEALEDTARAALLDDWALDPWLAALAALEAPPAPGAETPLIAFWSDGSPFVAACALVFSRLPAGADFCRLLVDPEEAAA